MGIQNFWLLIAPVGRKVSIETLANKILAIDASIWLTQFVKAMRDEDGNLMHNAHLLGTFRRVVRLLYHGIKPVFVFDGGTPLLKRQTIQQRRKRRNQQEQNLKQTAKRIFLNQLKMSKKKRKSQTSASLDAAPAATGGQGSSMLNDAKKRRQVGAFSAMFTPPSLPHNARKKDDVHENSTPRSMSSTQSPPSFPSMAHDDLPPSPVKPKPPSWTFRGKDAPSTHEKPFLSRAASGQRENDDDDDVENDDRYELVVEDQVTDIDFDQLIALPPLDRSELAQKIQQNHREMARSSYIPLAGKPKEYSHTQISNFLRNCRFNEKMRRANSAANPNEDPGRTIASNSNRKFILSKEVPWKDSKDVDVDVEKEQKEFVPIKQNDDKLDPQLLDDEAADLENALRESLREQVHPQDVDHDRKISETIQAQSATNEVDPMKDDENKEEDIEEDGGFLEEEEEEEEEKQKEEEDMDLYFLHRDEVHDITAAIQASLHHPPRRVETEPEPAQVDIKNVEGNGKKKNEPTKMDLKAFMTPQEIDDVELKTRFGILPSDDVNVDAIKQEKLCMPMPTELIEMDDDDSSDSVNSDIEWEDVDLIDDGGNGVTEKTAAVHQDLPLNGVDEEKTKALSVDSVALKSVVKNEETSMLRMHTNDISISSPSQDTLSNTNKTCHLFKHDTKVKESTGVGGVSAVDVNVSSVHIDAALQTASNLSQWAAGAVRRAVHKYNTKTGIEEGDKKDEEWETETVSHLCQDANVQEHDRDANDEKNDFNSTIDVDLDLDQNVDADLDQNADADAGEREEVITKEEVLEILADSQTLQELEKEQLELHALRKRQQRDIEGVSSEMVDDVIELLELFGVPYIVSPMEAEAQCAELEKLGLVHGIITDDSDIFAFGGRCVYKNIFDDRKFVEAYMAEDIEKEFGMDQDAIISFAMLLGSDYTNGVNGVGIVNATEIISAFPGFDGLHEFKAWVNTFNPQEEVQKSMKKKNYTPDQLAAMPSRERFQITHAQIRHKWQVVDPFPCFKVRQAYKEPEVDSSTDPFSWCELNTKGLHEFCRMKFFWEDAKSAKILAPLEKKRSEVQQTRIDAFFQPTTYAENVTFARIRSKRLRQAVQGLRPSDDSSLPTT